MSVNNKQANESSSVANQPTAGYILSQRREKLGLDVEKCASSLKISPQKLEALEADDYSAFTSDLFVRGYLRNYAKLVELPIDDVLASYQQTQDTSAVPAAEAAAMQLTDKKSLWWLPYLIGISIIALWVFLYQVMALDSGKPTPSDVLVDEKTVPVLQSEASEALANKPAVNSLEAEAQVPAAEVETGELKETSSLTEGETLPSSEVLPSTEPQSAVSEAAGSSTPPIVVNNVTASELIKSIAPKSEPEPESAPVPAQSAPLEDTLLFAFAEDCWIQVTDSSGRVVMSGLQRGKTKLKLVGKAPFKVVLGNARGTTLALNDAPVALANQRTLRLVVGG